MQAYYPARFSREVGCTEAEWLMWLPAAVGLPSVHPVERTLRLELESAADGATEPGVFGASGPSGSLELRWQLGQPRRIASIALPRLIVDFAFEGLDDARRHAFMKRFDLYMQRGGG